MTHHNFMPDDLDPKTRERLIKSLEVLLTIEKQVLDGQVASCRECSTALPDDAACAFSEDGQHHPDQTRRDPEGNEPRYRQIDVVFSVQVPNDGYDYATDVTGRLEQVLDLLTLHPLISAAWTRSGSRVQTGSGYDGDTQEPPHQLRP